MDGSTSGLSVLCYLLEFAPSLTLQAAGKAPFPRMGDWGTERWSGLTVVVQSLSRVRLFATPWTSEHARVPSPSLFLGACSNSCPLSQRCHPTISSSVAPFSSCLQSFPASGYFPMSQFFTSGGQSTGVSALASVLPINIQIDFL